jgi:hypothetical protein
MRGLEIRLKSMRYELKLLKILIQLQIMINHESNHSKVEYTCKDAQVVTNLQQTCSNAVPTTYVNRMCSHCLFPVC